MENQTIDLKEQFYKTLDDLMTKNGFVKKDNQYIKEFQSNSNSQIFVYGRMVQCPKYMCKQILTLLGDGWISDIDESNKVPYSQLKFEVYANDNIELNFEPCLFYNEIDELTNYINKSFNIN